MEQSYVEHRDGGYWISGTRISLDSVVLAFLDGLSPETIATECFPLLTLEQVYGGITYYLSHRSDIDAYLKLKDEDVFRLRELISDTDKAFAIRLVQSRRDVESSRS